MRSAPVRFTIGTPQGAPSSAPRSHVRAQLRAPLPLSIVEAPAVEGVYLLAFLHRGEHVAYGASASTRGHAMHYLGHARNIRERVREHVTGRGARLTLAAFLAGYEMRLVRVWAHAGRDIERRLKRAHRLALHCPLCKYRIAPAPIPAPILDTGAGVEQLAPPLWRQGIGDPAMAIPCAGACGAWVDVLCNPLDASDPRPLCYDCAIREREARRAETARAVVGLACDGWAPEQVMAFYRLREGRRRRELGRRGDVEREGQE